MAVDPSPLRSLGRLAALCALALLASGGGEARAIDPSPYSGLGTWIDIYSPSFRADPGRVVATLDRRGVQTLYVQTGNFRQRVDVVAPRRLGRLVEAAHARGIAVVAWYLPGLAAPARDLRRARAAIALRTSAGQRFDSFALDIESSEVRDSGERTGRLLALSARLRAGVGPGYPLGAIIPSPVGMRLLPRYWPRFPYTALARNYDALLPMAYYSHRVRGPDAVGRYVRTSVRIIRAESADPTIPIHVIGGLAGATSTAEATAFARAATSCGADGLSLYDFHGTMPAVWRVLGRAATQWPLAEKCM
jgi:hypothetical protein